MSADRRAFVNHALLIAKYGDLLHPSAHDGAAAGFDLVVRVDFAFSCPIGVLASDVQVFLDEFTGSTQSDARRVVELGPRVLAAKDQVGEKHTSDRAVGDAVSRAVSYTHLRAHETDS